ADPGRLRVGLLTFSPAMGGPVDPECVTAATDTGALLESLGHHVEVAHPRGLERPEWSQNFITLWAAGVALGLETWSRRTGRRIHEKDVEPLTWALAETGDGIGAMALLSAHAWLSEGNRDVAQWFRDPGNGGADGFDLLLTPTLAEPPVPLGTFASQPDNPLGSLFRAGAFCPFTPPFNITGQPAISLPLHWTPAGLPVGVQLVAAYGAEDVLLRVAAQLEEARPWAGRWPSVCAR
ncbi:MAG: amidase family protein, partial [Acidimicrobiia bacterium]